MSRKKTIEEVREYIENQGYELLSDEYENASTKLKIKCHEEHEFLVSWSNFHGVNGSRCPKCANKLKSIKMRTSIKFVEEYVKKQGYILLSTKYENASSRLKFKCLKGHEYITSWDSFYYAKGRCPFCAPNGKKLISDVKNLAKELDCLCLDNKYINNITLMEFVCSKGHKFKTSYNDLKNKRRCPICEPASNRKRTIEEIRLFAKEYEFKLISNIYINNHTKLEFKCLRNHYFLMDWANFEYHHKCPICNPAVNKKKTIKEIKEYSNSFGYKLLSVDYEPGTKLKFECSKSHIFEMAWSNFQQGQRCAICSIENNSGCFKCGDEHPFWSGGISFEPYPFIFNEKLKKKIKERDGYKCMNERCSKTNFRLCIHHIDYNKKNCSKQNLITVCISCNSRANSNRNWWTNFYQNLLHEEYGYIYENIEKENNECFEIQ